MKNPTRWWLETSGNRKLSLKTGKTSFQKIAGLFISNFRGFSVEVGEVFCSKLTPFDCRFDREIDGELLKNALKFAPKMAPNGLRAIPEIGNKHARASQPQLR